MSLVALGGGGFWVPLMYHYAYLNPEIAASGLAFTLDADEEEGQIIGSVTLEGGSAGGSKTFGMSSKLGWATSTTATFAAGSTLRVGVKQASKIDTATGPPARATIGAAAFDVSRALVGGTDALAGNTWRDDTMVDGTPFTVSHGDLIAVCFHLDVASGTPAVTIRGFQLGSSVHSMPSLTQITAGPTYTVVGTVMSNCILVFDDGTLGWLEPARIAAGADVSAASMGNGNRQGNIIQLPVPVQIDALANYHGNSFGDFAFDVVGNPLGTPSTLSTVAVDANTVGATSNRVILRTLPTPVTLAANTPYAIAVRQTTATAMTMRYMDVTDATYFKALGFGGICYAANATGSGAFVVQNSQRRRYHMYMRVCALDDGTGGGAGGGGGAVFGATGGVIA